MCGLEYPGAGIRALEYKRNLNSCTTIGNSGVGGEEGGSGV